MLASLIFAAVAMTSLCVVLLYTSERVDHHDEDRIGTLLVALAIPCMIWIVALAIFALSVLL